jgi:hypothetical protein
MADWIDPDAAQPGTVYKVTLSDCCVRAEFTAELIEIVRDDADLLGPFGLKFANGVTASGSNVGLEPVP